MKTVRVLMNSAIDYAGLFPPAALDMNEAVEEYAECRAGALSWALGRFVVPVSRLDELNERIAKLASRHVWPLSVLGGTDPGEDGERVNDFLQRCPVASVEALEWKPVSPGEIRRVLGVFRYLPVFFEISLVEESHELIEAVAAGQARAKVRTGGTSPGMFPSPAQLARFILRCAEARIPFKATAGLHHPLRSVQPLTPASQSPPVMMHGFLNVLIASAAAYAGAGTEALEEILGEEAIGAFRFKDAEIGWRKMRFSVERLRELRGKLFISFGSCSFREPLEGMRALGIL